MTSSQRVSLSLLLITVGSVDFQNPVEADAEAFVQRIEQKLGTEPKVFDRLCLAAALGKMQFGPGGADWGPENADGVG